MEVKKITQGAEEGPGGVIIEHSDWKPETDAKIIE